MVCVVSFGLTSNQPRGKFVTWLKKSGIGRTDSPTMVVILCGFQSLVRV